LGRSLHRDAGRIDVISPSTEEHVGSVPDGTEGDMDAAVAAARGAFDDPTGWSSWSTADRADILDRLATALEARAEETAHRVSMQNGMLITIARQLEGAFPAIVPWNYPQTLAMFKLAPSHLARMIRVMVGLS
jgi:aldehyde dehydrogenase (NAD+)